MADRYEVGALAADKNSGDVSDSEINIPVCRPYVDKGKARDPGNNSTR